MSWSATFDVWLLDETLTKEDIAEALRGLAWPTGLAATAQRTAALMAASWWKA